MPITNSHSPCMDQYKEKLAEKPYSMQSPAVFIQRLHSLSYRGCRRSLWAFTHCLWGTCEDETIALSKGMASAQLIPLHSSCAIHREGPCGRCAGCSASGISFPLHSSTCLQLRIVYFLRNRKLWSELLEKCWPCQALQDRQHALGNSECLIQG